MKVSRFRSPVRLKLPAALVATCAACAAFFAIPALAQAAPTWHICEKVGGIYSTSECNSSGTEWEWVPFTGEETVSSTGGPFSLSVPAKGLVINCTTETNTGRIFGGNKDEATIHFTGCSVEGAAKCVVAEPITTEVDTELIEIGGVIYDKFTPKTSPFTTIVISKCAAAGSFPVTGNIAGKVGPRAVSGTLTFSKEISEASGTELKFGESTAYLTGTSLEKLTGAHEGATWGAS